MSGSPSSLRWTIPTSRASRTSEGLARAISDSFYRAHLQRFGYADRGEPVEIVNLRLKLDLAVDKPDLQLEAVQGSDSSGAQISTVSVAFRDGELDTPLYQRELLAAGNRIAGPALVVQLDTTTVVPPGWQGEVDAYGNLLLAMG